MRTYYKVLSNDGVEQSNELKTLKQARKEKQDIIEEDWKEFQLEEDMIHYYIVKYTEKDGVIYEEEVQ